VVLQRTFRTGSVLGGLRVRLRFRCPPLEFHIKSLDPYGDNGADGIHMGERLRDRGLFLEGEGAFTRAVGISRLTPRSANPPIRR